MSKLHWAIKLRKVLLMPFSCKWNAWLRDFTAYLEVTLKESNE